MSATQLDVLEAVLDCWLDPAAVILVKGSRVCGWSVSSTGWKSRHCALKLHPVGRLPDAPSPCGPCCSFHVALAAAALRFADRTGGRSLDRDSRVFLTARTALAAATSFLVAWWCGPLAIRWLKRHFRERIDSASAKLNELHAGKQATPTMGGLFVVAAIVVAVLACGDLTNTYVHQVLFVVITFGALGAVDDWVKIRTSKRGLTVRQKFVAQWGLALFVATWLYFMHRDRPHGLDLIAPIGGWTWSLGWLFIAWAAPVLVGV